MPGALTGKEKNAGHSANILPSVLSSPSRMVADLSNGDKRKCKYTHYGSEFIWDQLNLYHLSPLPLKSPNLHD